MLKKTAAVTDRPTVRINRDTLWDRIWKNKEWYFIAIPVFLYFVWFKFIPIYYVQIAFRKFRITMPVSSGEWVGLKYFAELFGSPGFITALKNTVFISFLHLVFGFPAPIILALLLNELRNKYYKRIVQTLLYLPHFITWPILAGIMFDLMRMDGLFNYIISQITGNESAIRFMSMPELFRPILIISGIYKGVGWGTILYLAALTRIDPQLYESAWLDGASRFQQTIYISIPGLADVIVVLLILRLGHLLDVGFEQILTLMSPETKVVGDVIDTYVYRVGLLNMRFSLATAAGLFKTAVATTLLMVSDRVSKKLGNRGLF